MPQIVQLVSGRAELEFTTDCKARFLPRAFITEPARSFSLKGEASSLGCDV